LAPEFATLSALPSRDHNQYCSPSVNQNGANGLALEFDLIQPRIASLE
jgi:hypothetical protein